ADSRTAIGATQSPHRFTVHHGGEPDGGDAVDDVSRTLSPSAAAAIGDCVTAMIGPLAGGIATRNVTVFAAAALLVLIARSRARRSALTEREILGISPAIAAFSVLGFTIGVDPGRGVEYALVVAAVSLGAGAVAAFILDQVHERFIHTRLAVIGPASHAHNLAYELARHGVRRYTVTGYIGRDGGRENLRDLRHVSFKVRRLGVLADLSHIVARNDVDLLVLVEGDQRLEVFKQAAICSERYRTRLVGLPAFGEAVFQRVALEQLNVAWLQHLMHPRFRGAPRAVTRAIDLAGASLLALLTAPLWITAAALVRLSGRGPVIERHRRVGEHGRSFSILKFRTTSPLGEDEIPALTGDSPRTHVGRLLRRTNIDALPLLLNVLRGDISLVGPRPASPHDVARLEQGVPFYSRRHLLKPGVTGWAQLHAARDAADQPEGEEAGGQELPDAVPLNLSRDLFYLKHQSLFLYAYVLVVSVWRAATGSLRARSH
ncbi:MAG: sugar transferase, partial [Solirubrobacterales bacterium]